MPVLVILGQKCTLAASRAVPWLVTSSMRRWNRQTDGHQTVTLPTARVDTASETKQSSNSSRNSIKLQQSRHRRRTVAAAIFP